MTDKEKSDCINSEIQKFVDVFTREHELLKEIFEFPPKIEGPPITNLRYYPALQYENACFCFSFCLKSLGKMANSISQISRYTHALTAKTKIARIKNHLKFYDTDADTIRFRIADIYSQYPRIYAEYPNNYADYPERCEDLLAKLSAHQACTNRRVELGRTLLLNLRKQIPKLELVFPKTSPWLWPIATFLYILLMVFLAYISQSFQ